MKTKIFQPVHVARTPGSRAAFGALAATLIALAPACVAQTVAVEVPVPPTAALVAAAGIPGASSSISRVTSGAETLHLLVGHSLFLNTKLRLRKVFIADPTIVNSITVNPNQLLITAATPGVSSLILMDEAGQAQSYVVSSDLDIQGMRTAISEAMGQNTVNVEASGNRVILSGNVSTQAYADTAVKLATMYTKDVANSLTVVPEHPKQVRLKVRILEVDRSKLNQFGINLFNPGGNTSFLASTTTSQFPSTATLGSAAANAIGALTTTSPLNFLLYSAKLNLGATIQDLESKNILQILAEPTITTIAGQKAEFLSGGEFPFPVVQPGTSGGSASVTISFKPYGVKLEFTPIVNADGTIRLHVAPEVSALDYTNTVNISGYTIPAISSRKADTEVELRSDQSFAISGLLDQRTTDLYNKTPGAASIPIIGALFKSKSVTHSTTELIVIVTPSIVDPLAETAPPAEPGLPVPTLNTNKFDNSLGSHANPNAVAPPINSPTEPAFINQGNSTPVPAPAANPPAGAAQDVAPTPAPHAAPAAPAHEEPVLSGPTNALNLPPTQLQLTAQPPKAGTISAMVATPVQFGTLKIVPQSVPVPSMADATEASIAPPSLFPSQAPDRYVFDNPADPTALNVPHADNSVRAMVQIVALSHKEDADAMVTALKRHGYDVSISQDPHDSLLHLEVGPFKTTTDAEAMRQRLMVDGYNATVK